MAASCSVSCMIVATLLSAIVCDVQNRELTKIETYASTTESIMSTTTAITTTTTTAWLPFYQRTAALHASKGSSICGELCILVSSICGAALVLVVLVGALYYAVWKDKEEGLQKETKRWQDMADKSARRKSKIRHKEEKLKRHKSVKKPKENQNKENYNNNEPATIHSYSSYVPPHWSNSSSKEFDYPGYLSDFINGTDAKAFATVGDYHHTRYSSNSTLTTDSSDPFDAVYDDTMLRYQPSAYAVKPILKLRPTYDGYLTTPQPSLMANLCKRRNSFYSTTFDPNMYPIEENILGNFPNMYPTYEQELRSVIQERTGSGSCRRSVRFCDDSNEWCTTISENNTTQSETIPTQAHDTANDPNYAVATKTMDNEECEQDLSNDYSNKGASIYCPYDYPIRTSLSQASFLKGDSFHMNHNGMITTIYRNDGMMEHNDSCHIPECYKV